MDQDPPLTAFSFHVRFHGIGSEFDGGFQTVSGLTSEREVVEVPEGGVNTHVHRLPARIRTQNVVLKRGIFSDASPLRNWVTRIMQSELSRPIDPKDLTISLLDENGDPAMSWVLNNAYPVKFDVDALDAMKSALAVETLEFAYAELRRVSSPISTGVWA